MRSVAVNNDLDVDTDAVVVVSVASAPSSSACVHVDVVVVMRRIRNDAAATEFRRVVQLAVEKATANIE